MSQVLYSTKDALLCHFWEILESLNPFLKVFEFVTLALQELRNFLEPHFYTEEYTKINLC